MNKLYKPDKNFILLDSSLLPDLYKLYKYLKKNIQNFWKELKVDSNTKIALVFCSTCFAIIIVFLTIICVTIG